MALSPRGEHLVSPLSLEGKIVRFSDRIAYVNHDTDDAVRAGLLKETDLPVREIAFQTGYDDPLNFSRMFRKVCGVSPTQFRNSTAYGDQKK